MKQITHPKKKLDFNPRAFLSTIGKGRDMASFQKKNTIFRSRRFGDGLFFIQKGKVRLSVVSEGGEKQPLVFWAKVISLEKAVCRSAFAHVVCNRDDRLRPSAYREEGDDACVESGTKIVGHVSQYLLKRNIRYQDAFGRPTF